jgi:cold shock CspA family protein
MKYQKFKRLGAKMKGTIVQYFTARGYGFLVDDQNVKQLIFFHISNYSSTVTPARGLVVEYELGQGREGKGPEARRIVPAPVAAAPAAPAAPAPTQTLSSAAAVLAEKTIAEVK